MTEKPQARTVSRRTFLKGTAAATAMAAVAVRGGLYQPILRAAREDAEPTAADTTTRYSFCRMCHRSFCPIVATVENGIVTRVEGDTRGPWSDGRLCVRGNSMLMHLYNPYRVKAPLKRTNPKKGLDVDPGWVEISWDQALSTVVDKLKPLRTTDPRKFLFLNGFGEDYTLLTSAFSQAYGTPNSLSFTGAMCSVHWGSLLTHGYSTSRIDPGYCNYCITIGDSLGPNLGHAEASTIDVVDAINRGMRIVAVDPHLSPEASKGEWVPIRPGTDLAFLLAFANTIINELQTFDTWFVKNRSNGPYLIGPDGYYVRGADKKPLIWDPTDNKPKSFDDPSIKDYALEGAFTVGSVQARPAFALIKEQLKPNTPEWAAQITTIPAETIRRLSKEFVQAAQIGSTIKIDAVTFPYRPVAFTIRRGGTNHFLGHLADWMVMVINTLVGAMDVPGGSQAGGAGPTLKPDADGTVTPSSMGESYGGGTLKLPLERLDAAELYPYGFSQGLRIASTILEPSKYYLDYKPEAMLTFGTNLYSKAAAEADRIGQALSQIPFVASLAYHLDEHSAFADIVLPESSFMERTLTRSVTERRTWSLKKTLYTGAMVGQPIVPPLYQSRQADAIYIDLADRLGMLLGKGGLNDLAGRRFAADFKLDVNKKYTIEEIVDRSLKSSFGTDKGLEYFKQAGFIANPMKASQAFNYSYFPDNKTRHPIYNMALRQAGDDLIANLKKAGIKHPSWTEDQIRFYYQPFPSWGDTPTAKAPADFDLYAVVWKTPSFLFDISNSNANPYLQEVSSTSAYFGRIVVNPATAAKKGLKDGDVVYVEGQFGGKVGPVPIKVSGTVHPDVAGVESGVARTVTPGGNPIMAKGIAFNRLLSTREDTLDIITAAIELSPRVRVTKA